MTDPVVDAWHTGKLDAELTGHLQNKGWADKPVETVALEALKAHRDAERLIGVPANDLIRVPKEAKDEAGWKTLYQRLGAPSDAKEYDFASIKKSDGNPIDPGLESALREKSFSLHLPKDTASELAKAVVKSLDDKVAADTAERSAKLETERAELAKNWGPNKDVNMLVAKNAARALGVSPETVAALEKEIGYPKIMEMFRTIGSKIGEDKFITSQAPGGGGVMTREQSIAKKAELMKDTAWAKRYLDGGAAENREMMALNTIIVGDDTDASRSA